MRILALDISSEKTGFAFLEDDLLLEYGILDIGQFKKKVGSTNYMISRFGDMVDATIKRCNPDKLIIENIYLGKNLSTVLLLAMLAGVARYVGYGNKVECYKIFPKSVEVYLGISSEKLKRDIRKQRIVDKVNEKHKLKLSLSDNDIADAISMGECAMYKLNHGEVLEMI